MPNAQAFFSFLKDNVLSAVAAIAALFYGYFEFINKQANQEKQFIEQFAQSIEKFRFPQKCADVNYTQFVHLQVARSASSRLEQDFGLRIYTDIVDPLHLSYSAFKGTCDAAQAPGAGDPETKEIALARSVAQSNIQWQEGSRVTPADAGWFTVVASLPQGHKDEGFARTMICEWRSREKELETWQFQIWKTALSKSIAIVVNGEQSRAAAAQGAQLIRANERFRPYFYDAYAQANRDWVRVTDKVDCAGGLPVPAAPAESKSPG